jgi:transcription-repair coupling factor (superfamily II helicase)
VFFVHNRVRSIGRMAHQLAELVPEATFVVGHGQMGERELERTMLAFVDRRAQVLVSTTIVESGLHIPAANTIFVDRAETYGLADLHQLRGRVGRSDLQAYAYFLIRADAIPTEVAEKRLHAIEEFNHLGAGFQLAMRDLEIRGAGNILGPEQSGHIAAVGYDLYCRLLEMAVKRLKQEPILDPEEIELFVDFDAYIPEAYVADLRLRIEVYRKLGRCRAVEDFERVVAELSDRFGPPPAAVVEFVDVARIRGLMERERIQRLEIVKGEGVLVAVKRLDRFAERLKLPPDGVRVIGGRRVLLVHQGPFTGPGALLRFLESAV